jgi:fatty acid desaturase
MQDNFHETEHLPQEKLMLLIKKNDHAILKFVMMYSYILLTATALVLSWGQSIWMIILAHIAFAPGFCSSFACEHETVHNTAFKSKFWNSLAARLSGLVQIYAPSMFQELHFTHHRYTHVPGKDPEISFGGKPIPSSISSLPMYFSWISGLPLFIMKFIMFLGGIFGMPEFFRKAVFPFFRPRMRLSMFLDCLLLLAVHGTIITLAILLSPGFWFIYSGILFGHCVLSVYLVPEHNGLSHEGNIMEKTRSMQTSNLLRSLMWNMPYHAEHHAYPAVPFHALPALRKELEEEIQNYEQYPAFHLKVLSRKVK